MNTEVMSEERLKQILAMLSLKYPERFENPEAKRES